MTTSNRSPTTRPEDVTAGQRAGQTLVDGVTGQSAVVLSTAVETSGEYAEVEVIWTASSPPSPERSFVGHELRFEIREGRLVIEIDGEERRLRAGEAVTLPAGTRHRIWVDEGAPPARFVWRIRPAPREKNLLAEALGEPGDAESGN